MLSAANIGKCSLENSKIDLEELYNAASARALLEVFFLNLYTHVRTVGDVNTIYAGIMGLRNAKELGFNVDSSRWEVVIV